MLKNTINSKSSAIKSIALFCFAFFISGLSLSAQDLDSEAGFIYLKAKYLYETDRHNDAIREFNKVIKKVADYEDALVLRAESKFALAAYKGAELDALEYIALKGITPDVSIVLGKSQYQLENFEAAKNTLVTAVQLNPNDPDPLEILAEIAQEDGELLSACDYWKTAAKLGSSKAQEKSKKNCGETVEAEIETQIDDKEEVISIGSRIEGDPIEEKDVDPETNEDEEEDEEESGTISVGTRVDDDKTEDKSTNPVITKPSEDESKVENSNVVKKPKTNTDDQDQDKEETSKVEIKVVDIEEEKEEEIDDTPNEIVIDEELKLLISGQGLGRREIVKTPNILILSEQDGIVVIDICVNKQGRVESAEFNSKLSTIGKKSLISLALRKSKDFWFESDKSKKEQCGTILFDIKGS